MLLPVAGNGARCGTTRASKRGGDLGRDQLELDNPSGQVFFHQASWTGGIVEPGREIHETKKHRAPAVVGTPGDSARNRLAVLERPVGQPFPNEPQHVQVLVGLECGEDKVLFPEGHGVLVHLRHPKPGRRWAGLRHCRPPGPQETVPCPLVPVGSKRDMGQQVAEMGRAHTPLARERVAQREDGGGFCLRILIGQDHGQVGAPVPGPLEPLGSHGRWRAPEEEGVKSKEGISGGQTGREPVHHVRPALLVHPTAQHEGVAPQAAGTRQLERVLLPPGQEASPKLVQRLLEVRPHVLALGIRLGRVVGTVVTVAQQQVSHVAGDQDPVLLAQEHKKVPHEGLFFDQPPPLLPSQASGVLTPLNLRLGMAYHRALRGFSRHKRVLLLFPLPPEQVGQ